MCVHTGGFNLMDFNEVKFETVVSIDLCVKDTRVCDLPRAKPGESQFKLESIRDDLDALSREFVI